MSNIFRLSKKLTCNPSSIDNNRSLRSPAPSRSVGLPWIYKRYTDKKKVLYTNKAWKHYRERYLIRAVNENKLTFWSAFFQPRSTFAVQQHGRTVVAKDTGTIHSSRALPARVGVVIIFACNRVCGVGPGLCGLLLKNPCSIYDQNLWFSLPYLWSDQKLEPSLLMTCPCPHGKMKKVRVISSAIYRELRTTARK